LVLVLGAVLAFAVLLKPLGLALALVITIFVGAAGGPEYRAREVAMLAAALVALVLAVFVAGLGLPVPVWPAFLH
jgi:hypothetical protein